VLLSKIRNLTALQFNSKCCRAHLRTQTNTDKMRNKT
jgi:hypothetical protein